MNKIQMNNINFNSKQYLKILTSLILVYQEQSSYCCVQPAPLKKLVHVFL